MKKKHTIKFLYASAVVVRKYEVLCVHPLVEGSHDGWGVIGVLKTQSMTQFMHRNEEDVVTWNSGNTKTLLGVFVFFNKSK